MANQTPIRPANFRELSPLAQRRIQLAEQEQEREVATVRSAPPPSGFSPVQLREFYLKRERALRNGDKSWT